MRDDNEFLKAFGQRLRFARERVGLTQGELAKRVGKAQNLISKYESGLQAIRITELPILAETLGVTISYLFGEDYEDSEVDEISAVARELVPPLRKAINDLAHQYLGMQHRFIQAMNEAK